MVIYQKNILRNFQKNTVGQLMDILVYGEMKNSGNLFRNKQKKYQKSKLSRKECGKYI